MNETKYDYRNVHLPPDGAHMLRMPVDLHKIERQFGYTLFSITAY